VSTYALRQKFLEIARTNVGKKEVTRNQAPWIRQLWPATNYPLGYYYREPYCAAGMAWTLQKWLEIPEVLQALNMTPAKAEAWRCKSASVFRNKSNSWSTWARQKNLTILGADANFHAGDLIIYTFSHIEAYVDDLPKKRFMAIGYNTNEAGSRDGNGCWEKPRSRDEILEVIRILP
jgi:hypothetical protein